MYYLYLIRCGDSNYYKIGVSDNVQARLVSLQGACPYELILEAMCRIGSRQATYNAEAQAHLKLVDCRVRGEWFELREAQVQQLRQDMVACEARKPQPRKGEAGGRGIGWRG